MALMEFENDLKNEIKSAIEAQDPEKFCDTVSKISEKAAEKILNQSLTDAAEAADKQILMARGKRMLTSEETKFYNNLAKALKSPDFKNAITNADVVFPETIFDETFDDLTTDHAVISHLDVRVVNAKVKVYFATGDSGNKAIWGKITGKITKEIAGGFMEIDTDDNKCACFLSIPNAILDLGPEYMDQFVRTLLYEALANGIEDAVMNNLVDETGPIGMIADLGKGATIAGTGEDKTTTYTAKEPVAITDWTPEGLASIMEILSTSRNGNYRDVQGMYMIVNPKDYFKIVMPALMVKNGLAEWVLNSPYPCDIIKSPYVPDGKAFIGMDNRYALGISTAEAGQLDYSDDYQFLDEVRTYKIKLYGDGQPKDNTSFVYCDISGLKPATLVVTMADGSKPAATTGTTTKAAGK